VVEGLPVLVVGSDLRGHERDPAQHRSRTSAGASPQVRFALSDEQVAFRDATRDLLAKEPRDQRATWDALVEMGVTTVLVPEADGGLGMHEVTMVAILEETGYAALAFPIVETAMVAAPLGIVGPMAALADGALVAW